MGVVEPGAMTICYLVFIFMQAFRQALELLSRSEERFNYESSMIDIRGYLQRLYYGCTVLLNGDVSKRP